jgi:hypothetical protein
MFDDDFSDYPRGRRSFSESHPLANAELVMRFLSQSTAWKSAQGYIAIKDMTPGHALATVAFILERSLPICLAVMASGVDLSDDLPSETWRTSFLLDQPLVKALLERAGAAAAAEFPWERALVEARPFPVLADGTSTDWPEWAEALRDARELNDTGRASWASILVEEVAEAMLETDRQKIRGELVQVAAVAVKWVEAIDRDEE